MIGAAVWIFPARGHSTAFVHLPNLRSGLWSRREIRFGFADLRGDGIDFGLGYFADGQRQSLAAYCRVPGLRNSFCENRLPAKAIALKDNLVLTVTQQKSEQAS